MVEHRLIFRCDLCGSQQTVCRDVEIRFPGAALETQAIPSGWSWISGQFVCQRHRIILEDMAKEEEMY